MNSARLRRRILAWFACILGICGVALWAFDIQFDYTYDTSNFFSGANEGRRVTLEAAASVFETQLAGLTLPAITPSGSNHWNFTADNPTTGLSLSIADPTIPANTMIVYIGARNLSGTTIGLASTGYSCSGTTAWVKQFSDRDTSTIYKPFGGSIAFDNATTWYFDTDPTTVEGLSGKQDFYTTALHEIGHLLGITSSTSAFAAQTNGLGQFTGSNAVALFGGNVPLSSDLSHIKEDTTYLGKNLTMDPSSTQGTRSYFSALEFAMLKDIGVVGSGTSTTVTTGTLQVSVTPLGGGTVTSGYLGTTSQTVGGSIQLTATPASGFRFVGWTGDFTSSSTGLSFVMPASAAVTAVFESTSSQNVVLSVTVNDVGYGTVETLGVGNFAYSAGDKVTLTATPYEGYMFEKWTGGSDSTNPVLDLTLSASIAVEAVFKPLSVYAGTYEKAIVFSGEPDTNLVGSVRFSITSNGGISGYVTLGGLRSAFAGTLEADKSFSFTSKVLDKEVYFSMKQADASSVVYGGVSVLGTDTQAAFTVTASAGYGDNNPSPYKGRYTMAFAALVDKGANPMPEGEGYAVGQVGATGGMVLIGKMADGTVLGCTVPVGESGDIALGEILLAHRSAVTGTLQVSGTEAGTVSGQLSWKRESAAKEYGVPWEVGFSGTQQVRGSKWTRPTSGGYLLTGGTSSTGRGVLSLTASGQELLRVPVTMTRNQTVLVDVGATGGLVVEVDTSTGFLVGTFRDSDTLRGVAGDKMYLRKFEGVLLKEQKVGTGFFLDRYSGLDNGYRSWKVGLSVE